MRKLTIILAASIMLTACNHIDDEYTYGADLYTIDWNAAADSATTSLIQRFWNPQTGYFVYNNDQFTDSQDPGYWPQAHAMDVIIDAYLRTGRQTYADMFQQWYQGIKAVNFSHRHQNYINDYYDDSEWIALTMLRLYQATGSDQYLQTAQTLWEWIKTGWSNLGGGGIAWERTTYPHMKNACSNSPAALLGAQLYNITHNETDLQWAQKIYEWERTTLFNQATGAVYDGLNTATGELNTTTLTYNQGTFLGAAHQLYLITGDQTYLRDARRAAYYTITSTSTIDTGANVLRNEGTGDNALFKGIFIRYYTRLILSGLLDDNYTRKFTTFLDNNAETLWRQGTNKTTCSSDPRGPHPS